MALGGKWLVEVMAPDATAYTFRVLRERWVDAPAAAPGAAAGGDDIHELKSWAIADLPCSPRSPSAPSAAAAPAAGEQIDLGVFDMADGRTVPQWVFAQYAAMRKQASAELFSPQLGRAKAPQGSGPRASSGPRPRVGVARRRRRRTGGGAGGRAEPAPEPAAAAPAAPTTPAPAAAPASSKYVYHADPAAAAAAKAAAAPLRASPPARRKASTSSRAARRRARRRGG